MSQTGTPTEFLQLGITEPDDTLNVLVDLNGQWRKIDRGVKNVDTKANTNASGISALNTAVQDNTENITNILETNVNQQTSIDTLQSKVATLEEDDTSYGSRITAVEAGVQENSELINDLEVDLSGVKTSVGTVPSGSNLQGEVDGLDTRVTALENSGSVSALETRVGALETEVGTVPSGTTVQGQITTLNGQVNSGNIPFRFSVDGGGNYGYLKADDSFVPFSSGDAHWHLLDENMYQSNKLSLIVKYKDFTTQGSDNYGKLHDLKNDVDYTLQNVTDIHVVGRIILQGSSHAYIAKTDGTLTTINGTVACVKNFINDNTLYVTRNGNNIQYNVIDGEGNAIGLPVNYSLHGTPTGPINFSGDDSIIYKYGGVRYMVDFATNTGTTTERVITNDARLSVPNYKFNFSRPETIEYYYDANGTEYFLDITNMFIVSMPYRMYYCKYKHYYYI